MAFPLLLGTYKSEKVTALIIGTAVEVVGSLHAILTNIGSRIANRNLAVVARADVLSHVTSGGLDVRSGFDRLGLVVDNFIPREESECVRVLDKLINGSEDTLEVDIVVRWGRLVSVNRVTRVIDVENQVDASIIQGLHTFGVIGRVVNRVNANSVYAKFLEFGDVPVTDVTI